MDFNQILSPFPYLLFSSSTWSTCTIITAKIYLVAKNLIIHCDILYILQYYYKKRHCLAPRSMLNFLVSSDYFPFDFYATDLIKDTWKIFQLLKLKPLSVCMGMVFIFTLPSKFQHCLGVKPVEWLHKLMQLIYTCAKLFHKQN